MAIETSTMFLPSSNWYFQHPYKVIGTQEHAPVSFFAISKVGIAEKIRVEEV